MAKKSLMEELTKSGLLLKGSDPRLNPTSVPTGITPLDDIIGGGIPNGKCTLIVGPESTGKTIICQYIAAAFQKTAKPKVLYLDAERSYDPEWWVQSGVNPDLVLVAQPATGEQLIDLTIEVLEADADIGLVILDSVAGMPPAKIVEESAERHDIASLARLVNLFYQKIVPSLGSDRAFVATNQIREAMTGFEERYPGGASQRFFSHLILRTRRTEWIKEGEQRVGFVMEVTTRKNKTTAPQQHAKIPFMFRGQVDMLAVFIDDAIARGFIQPKLPYYAISGVEKKLLGKQALRDYLAAHPDVLEAIK